MKIECWRVILRNEKVGPTEVGLREAGDRLKGVESSEIEREA